MFPRQLPSKFGQVAAIPPQFDHRKPGAILIFEAIEALQHNERGTVLNPQKTQLRMHLHIRENPCLMIALLISSADSFCCRAKIRERPSAFKDKGATPQTLAPNAVTVENLGLDQSNYSWRPFGGFLPCNPLVRLASLSFFDTIQPLDGIERAADRY